METRNRKQILTNRSRYSWPARRRWLKVGLLAVSTLWNQHAGADTALCNRKDMVRVHAAMVYYSGNALFSRWMSRGWVSLDPGECKTVLSGGNMTEPTVYLSITKKTGDDEDQLVINDDATTEKFFCVRNDRGYELERESLAALSDCPDGYFLQLFHIQIENQEHGTMTFTLR